MFLVPYITIKLIMEDMKCNEMEAYKIMIESGDVGDGLHPEDDEDEELQDILDTNMDAVRAAHDARVKREGKVGTEVRDDRPSLLFTAHEETGKDDHGKETLPPRFAKKIFLVVRRHSSASSQLHSTCTSRVQEETDSVMKKAPLSSEKKASIPTKKAPVSAGKKAPGPASTKKKAPVPKKATVPTRSSKRLNGSK